MSKRFSVSKGSSARGFRGNVGRTKSLNMQVRPMRGGFRI